MKQFLLETEVLIRLICCVLEFICHAYHHTTKETKRQHKFSTTVGISVVGSSLLAPVELSDPLNGIKDLIFLGNTLSYGVYKQFMY